MGTGDATSLESSGRLGAQGKGDLMMLHQWQGANPHRERERESVYIYIYINIKYYIIIYIIIYKWYSIMLL